MHHEVSKSCNRRVPKEGKKLREMVLSGSREADRRKRGRKGDGVMLLHFNKQPIKHPTTSRGEQEEDKERRGRKKRASNVYIERRQMHRMSDETTGDERVRALCNDYKKPNDKRIIAVSAMHNPMGKREGFRLYRRS